MIELFGLIFFGAHQEAIISSESHDTSTSVSTAETPWHKMYVRDKYARDRVMKSVRLLLPYLKEGDTVLDVGCFTQEARKYLPSDVKYVGIDQKAYHKETKVVELNHGFEPIPSSHALCLETLEHLLDPRDALQSIAHSMSDQGFLVVSLPNEVTLFHRIRSFLGVVDAECFSESGKHLHLPSLQQSRNFLRSHFDIVEERFYISPSACGSHQAWVGVLLRLLPDRLYQFLADHFPSLFARGFIFLLKPIPGNTSHPLPTQSPPS